MIEILLVEANDWLELSEKFHLSVFNEHRDKYLDRIKFAIVTMKD